MTKIRLNHYYPAATLGTGYSPILKKSDKRDSKVKYVNINNFSKFIENLITNKISDINFILEKTLNKREEDENDKIPHTKRILSEISCKKIFTNLDLIEDINDKKSEAIISKTEQSFLTFLTAANLIDTTNDDDELNHLVLDNQEKIIEFLTLTINRIPCLDDANKKHFIKKLESYEISIILDYNLIFSDLLPIVPISLLDLKECKELFPFLGKNDCEFKWNSVEIDELIIHDLLIFPVSKKFALLLADEPVHNLFQSNPFYLEFTLLLYFYKSLLITNEFLIYDYNEENHILKEIIECILHNFEYREDFQEIRKKISEPYLSILHTKIKN